MFCHVKENQKVKQAEDTLLFSIEKGKLICSYLKDGGVRQDIALQIVNYTTDFNKRNKGIIDQSVLQEKTVTIIGVGSGGSAIAVDLVRSGVTNLIFIEFDTVETSNLCRSVYDLFDISRKKTDALLGKLLRINPCINVRVYDEDVMKMEHDQLMEIIDASDLIIEATDSAKTKMLINGLAHNNTPVLYPAVYDSGKGGDILFTEPGSPCFEGVFRNILPEMLELKKAEWDYTTSQPKSMPGLISDIQVVVARTVKLALAILMKETDNSLFEKITEPNCTLLLIGNEKNCSVFEKPFQEVWAETEIDPECMCQTLQ